MEEPSFPAAGIRRTGKEPKWAADSGQAGSSALSRSESAAVEGQTGHHRRRRPAAYLQQAGQPGNRADPGSRRMGGGVPAWTSVRSPRRPARRPWVQWGSEPNVLPHKVMANLDGLGCHAYICTDWQQREHCWRCRGDGVRVGGLTRTVGVGHHHDNVGRITTVKVDSASRPASGDASSTGRPEINAPVLS